MKIIEPSFEIQPFDAEELMKRIEWAARCCYKSEDKIADNSAEKMVCALRVSGHEAMLEHGSISVKFITQRSFSHELVRHRLSSFGQESQRYCGYDKGKFGSEITFVEPSRIKNNALAYSHWINACRYAEEAYLKLRSEGVPPEVARGVLPNDTKTEICMTANLREWRHIFKLRALGTTGKPDPRMLEVMLPLLEVLSKELPVVFSDLVSERFWENYFNFFVDADYLCFNASDGSGKTVVKRDSEGCFSIDENQMVQLNKIKVPFYGKFEYGKRWNENSETMAIVNL